MKQNIVAINPYTLSEIANLYKISTKTLKTLLRPHQEKIGPRPGKFFSVLQVRMIFSLIGLPGNFIIEDNTDSI